MDNNDINYNKYKGCLKEIDINIIELLKQMK